MTTSMTAPSLPAPGHHSQLRSFPTRRSSDLILLHALSRPVVSIDAIELTAAGEIAPAQRSLALGNVNLGFDRSEERRVGKECRSRWAAAHENKKSVGAGVLVLGCV